MPGPHGIRLLSGIISPCSAKGLTYLKEGAIIEACPAKGILLNRLSVGSPFLQPFSILGVSSISVCDKDTGY